MHPFPRPRLAAAALAALLAATPAWGQAPDTPAPEPADPAAVARGEALAAAHCAGCHSINPKGASPYRAAPAFRELPPVPPHALQARLRVLLGNPHYGMPQQFLTASEARDLAAFIESVKRPAAGDRRLRAFPCVATAC